MKAKYLFLPLVTFLFIPLFVNALGIIPGDYSTIYAKEGFNLTSGSSASFSTSPTSLYLSALSIQDNEFFWRINLIAGYGTISLPFSFDYEKVSNTISGKIGSIKNCVISVIITQLNESAIFVSFNVIEDNNYPSLYFAGDSHQKSGFISFILSRKGVDDAHPTSSVAATKNLAGNAAPLKTEIKPLVDMVLVVGGSFMMGSDSGDPTEDPVHRVTLSAFYIGKYEVTQGQYNALMGDNPSYFKDGSDAASRPIEKVSWYDAVTFCNLLSKKEGFSNVYMINGSSVSADYSRNGYRLPTEAEWEYAARGGGGSLGGYEYSGSNEIGSVAWYGENSGGTTHAVGTKAMNGLGLYDMTGNVMEWCWDSYQRYGSGSQSDPTGASSGTYRVLRGGSWDIDAENCRSAYRDYFVPADRNVIIGFRVLRRP